VTAEEYLRAAFKALLAGDLAERDRLCELSLKAHDEEQRLRTLAPNDPVGKQ
jgi:hypothetical protein